MAQWYNNVYEVEASPPVVALDKSASSCSKGYGVPAASVKDLYARMAAVIDPLAIRGVSTASLEAKGANVLVECFSPVVRQITRMLDTRKAQFFAENALAISQVQTGVENEIDALAKRFGGRAYLGSG